MIRHKKCTAHIHARPTGPGIAPRGRRSNPNTLKESSSAAPEFTRSQDVELLPRPITRSHAVRCHAHAGVGCAQHGCANQGQHDGAAPAKTLDRPLKQKPRGAARSNSRTRHLRAGRLAAPVAQTRRGPHDGYETKSCGVFE